MNCMSGKHALLTFCFLLSACATLPQNKLVGDWEGEVQTPLGDVELIFHFRELNDDLECSVESKFQGGVTIPCGEVKLDEDRLIVTVPAIRGRYRGVIEGDRIEGQWSQAGASFDFNLERI
ncbi:hypothetical protein F6455_04835 [Proteobacteria bacterium 005FR1]|nr:hypothetical protein [Proteobacteria bacterium 005FR1]